MADTPTFEDYLTSKKIDANQMKAAEKTLFEGLKEQFEQMHPNNFTQQNLFIINPIRRKYQLIDEPKVTAKPKTAAKPKFKKPS
ncbi:hypothetical protein [Reichenbachiella versicolor]|uniref:hypothetical protein n=1 Tax=Reichenbachiella versicolor TaxID=1821036 RepID=UPI001627B442|nr:hypothetical protein [Reichenbachiella versicolor]